MTSKDFFISCDDIISQSILVGDGRILRGLINLNRAFLFLGFERQSWCVLSYSSLAKETVHLKLAA